MRAKTWLVGVIGVLAACSGGSGAGGGDPAAALALTKAMSFDNGTLVPELMPVADANDVSLVPAPNQTITPGTPGLLSFDVDNPDAKNEVQFALLQFGGVSQHFEVQAMPAADGGTSGTHFALSYTVSSDVCSKLCNKTYPLAVVEAVKLTNDKVGKHATAAITLDCSETGDPKQCGLFGAAGAKSMQPGKCDGGLDAVNAGSGVMAADSPCGACLQSSCSSQANAVYGSGWRTGDLSGGACGPFLTCTLNCCGDTTCVQGCASGLTAACQNATPPLDSCISSSCASECNGASDAGLATSFDAGAGDSASCADLEAMCCSSSLFPASSVSSCRSIVTSGDATTCSQALQSFTAAGYCG